MSRSSHIDETGGETPLALMRAVLDPNRIHVLARLEAAPGPVDVEALGDSLAAERTDGRHSSRDALRMRTALVHVHLPKLEDADLVSHDRERGEVSPGESFRPLSELRQAWDRCLADSRYHPSE
jgi:DNA-binding transcriptional ArsR family regulator